MTAVRRKIDIEALVQWAYRDELPKRELRLQAGQDDFHGFNAAGADHLLRADNDDQRERDHTYQRYARIEPLHPDAALIESAVSALPNEQVVDWPAFRADHMADVIGITPANDIFIKDIERDATIVETTERSVRAVPNIRVRWQVFSAQALVVMHANSGTRPRWHVGHPRAAAVSVGNNRVAINGSCEGRDRYSKGANCPLDWSGQRIGAPRIEEVAFARLEYVVWRSGLVALADRLQQCEWLDDHEATGPAVPERPWITGMPATTRILWNNSGVAPVAANDDTAAHPHLGNDKSGGANDH